MAHVRAQSRFVGLRETVKRLRRANVVNPFRKLFFNPRRRDVRISSPERVCDPSGR